VPQSVLDYLSENGKRVTENYYTPKDKKEQHVKLPAYRAGLPGKVISFHIVPLPACPQAGTPPIPL
jgi:hypothetical protein